MSSINLRQMMAPKREPLFKKESFKAVVSIHPIQQRMMDFYSENPRCVIITPRQCGKSLFLIMQAVLSYKPVVIVVPNETNREIMYGNLKQFCNDNTIDYTESPAQSGIVVNNKLIRIKSVDRVTSYILRTNESIYIDEYDYIDLKGLGLADKTDVLLVGTGRNGHGTSAGLTVDEIGLFAGLNINDDGR